MDEYLSIIKYNVAELLRVEKTVEQARKELESLFSGIRYYYECIKDHEPWIIHSYREYCDMSRYLDYIGGEEIYGPY